MRHRKNQPTQTLVAEGPEQAAAPDKPADLGVRKGGMRLGEMLVEASLVTEEQVTTALQEAQRGTGKRLGQLLVELGILDERDLARVLGKQQSLEVVDLRQITPDPAATDLMSEATSRALTSIALSIDGDTVVVAVADPAPNVITSLNEVIGKRVTVKVAAESDILRAIGNSYRALTGVGSQVKVFEARDTVRKDTARVETIIGSDDAPVVQVVQLMITQGLRDRASDIHVEPQEDRVRVRYRIDGALHDVLDLPGSMGSALVSRIKILAGMNIVERRRSQDGQISMDVEGRAVDIRVASTAVIGGEKVVMRLLDKSRPLFKLEQLGMPPDKVRMAASALPASPANSRRYGMRSSMRSSGMRK